MELFQENKLDHSKELFCMLSVFMGLMLGAGPPLIPTDVVFITKS